MALMKKIPFFLLAFCAGLLSGVDTTVSGGMLTLAAFLKSFFPLIYVKANQYNLPNTFCQYTNSTLTFVASIPYILGMVVGFFSIYLQLRFGLRKLMMASTFIVFVGGGISLIDPIHLKCFLSGRILLGIGLGVFRQVVSKYLGEVPPRTCRDSLDVIYQLSSNLGTLIGNILIMSEFGNSNSKVWRLMGLPAIIIAFFLCILSYLIPESPLYLMICRKDAMARQSLERILDPNQVQEELDTVIEEADVLREINPLRELFKRSSWPHLGIHIPSFFFRSFMGASTFLLFLPVFLIETGLGKSVSFSASLCTTITSIVVGFTSAMLIQYFQFGRRRNIITVGYCIVVAMQLLLGILLHKSMKPEVYPDDLLKNAIIVSMCLFTAGTTLVVNPMGWLSQSYPRTAHSVGSVFSGIANPTVDFLLSIAFLHILCSIKARIFFIFGAVSALASLYIFVFLPNDLPGVAMNQQWGAHCFWGQFVNNGHAADAPVVVEHDHVADAPVVVADGPDV